MKHFTDALHQVIINLDNGRAIEPGSPLHQRLSNEIKWLHEGTSDPITDAFETLWQSDLTKKIALDLHDTIASDTTLSNTEKCKLHAAINLKLRSI